MAWLRITFFGCTKRIIRSNDPKIVLTYQYFLPYVEKNHTINSQSQHLSADLVGFFHPVYVMFNLVFGCIQMLMSQASVPRRGNNCWNGVPSRLASQHRVHVFGVPAAAGIPPMGQSRILLL